MWRNRRFRSLLGLMVISLMAGLLVAGPGALPYLQRHRSLVKSARAWYRGARFVGDEGVVLQPRTNLCGAAALKAVLSAHNIESEIPDLAERLRTTALGTSLLDLRLVATEEGLPGRSWMLDAADLSRIPLPAIAFVYGDHFVVIRTIVEPDVLEVDDPSLGRLRWPVPSFSKAWSGETLVFDPMWSPT
jgi:peptidase C39-like protein